MTARPDAILWFERLYLAAVALKIASSILNWHIIDAGAVQIAMIVNLLLWFGVVHRHSTLSYSPR